MLPRDHAGAGRLSAGPSWKIGVGCPIQATKGVGKAGTITFAPGERTRTITIEVKSDTKNDADESFYLDLFGLSSNALLTEKRGIGTILDDD